MKVVHTRKSHGKDSEILFKIGRVADKDGRLPDRRLRKEMSRYRAREHNDFSGERAGSTASLHPNPNMARSPHLWRHGRHYNRNTTRTGSTGFKLFANSVVPVPDSDRALL